MAVTRLADVLEPDVWQEYFSLRSVEMSALWASGAIATSADLQARVNGGGRIIEMPFFDDLPDTLADLASDDPASSATAENIGTGKDVSRRHHRNKTWGATDLASSVIGEDIVSEIITKVAGYWNRQDQRLFISSMKGVIADNVANDSGDMVHDVYEDVATPTAGANISASNVLDALQTLGDHSDSLALMVAHSATVTKMKKLNLISFIPDSEGVVRFQNYLNLRLIVDDQMPVVAGTNASAYSTWFFGPGAWGAAEGSARVPFEIERDAKAADGAGLEELTSRRQFMLHPRGVQFTSASIAGETPSNAELEDAANWDRVYDRKLIRVAELKHNVF